MFPNSTSIVVETPVQSNGNPPGQILPFAVPEDQARDLRKRLKAASRLFDLPPRADPDTASFSPAFAERFLQERRFA